MKFLKKGIRNKNKYYPVIYSKDNRADGQKGITIYAKSILAGLPATINPENESDLMTDYFEKDRVFISQSKFCNQLKAIYNDLAKKEIEWNKKEDHKHLEWLKQKRE